MFRNCPVSRYAIRLDDETDFSSKKESVMRLLVKTLVILVICLAGIGFWQGWFTVTRNTSPDVEGSKVNFNVAVDKAKVKSDVKKAKEIVKEEVRKLEGKDKSNETK